MHLTGHILGMPEGSKGLRPRGQCEPKGYPQEGQHRLCVSTMARGQEMKFRWPVKTREGKLSELLVSALPTPCAPQSSLPGTSLLPCNWLASVQLSVCHGAQSSPNQIIKISFRSPQKTDLTCKAPSDWPT